MQMTFRKSFVNDTGGQVVGNGMKADACIRVAVQDCSPTAILNDANISAGPSIMIAIN
ncbi:hypothetical protein [Xanthomonas phaseoli]|uniref:hypothetical protein n=1 Tax=Xanthomonas phaseoli TaxID=1985254 RepID=UPI00036275CE|nr:hypothetical protein [Xanthomonas phaseoli]